MKKLLLPLIITLLSFSIDTKACISPDSVVQIIVNYDTSFVWPCAYSDEAEIRLTNLRFMNETPNKICACGLESLADLFDNINYVAFVDSGTNDPYDGFAGWEGNIATSDAWASSAGGNWSGFIADVINGGLSSSSPVEMVIRATCEPGTYAWVDTSCVGQTVVDRVEASSLGTDAWDPIAEDLDQSHQEVRSLSTSGTGNSLTSNNMPASYFTNLDNDILNNLPVDTNTCSANFGYTVTGLDVDLDDLSNLNGLQYVHWDFGDGASESVLMGGTSHTYSTAGTYEVCIYNINNGDTCDSECADIEVGPVGISGLAKPIALQVHPNPATDQLIISTELPEQVQLELISVIGKRVKLFGANDGSRLNISDVAPGMYFLKAIGEDIDMMSEMIVINR